MDLCDTIKCSKQAYGLKLRLGAHILNETSKPPVNKTHFSNIAHLLLNYLKWYLAQYIWAHVSVDRT